MVSEGARPWGRGRSGDCDCSPSPEKTLQTTGFEGSQLLGIFPKLLAALRGMHPYKAFSPKRGLVFAVNAASAPPPFRLGGGGGFTENPKGRGSSRRGGGERGCVRGIWGGGGAPSPIYRENEPPFRRKRLVPLYTRTSPLPNKWFEKHEK